MLLEVNTYVTFENKILGKGYLYICAVLLTLVHLRFLIFQMGKHELAFRPATG